MAWFVDRPTPMSSTGRVLVGSLSLAIGLVLAQSARADPLKLVLTPAALEDERSVLDEDTLSGIRGRGAEGLKASATGPGDVAVILWDEIKRRGQQSLTGSTHSHSSGQSNVQATNLSTVRY